jgi:hypothetical protein
MTHPFRELVELRRTGGLPNCEDVDSQTLTINFRDVLFPTLPYSRQRIRGVSLLSLRGREDFQIETTLILRWWLSAFETSRCQTCHLADNASVLWACWVEEDGRTFELHQHWFTWRGLLLSLMICNDNSERLAACGWTLICRLSVLNLGDNPCVDGNNAIGGAQ